MGDGEAHGAGEAAGQVSSPEVETDEFELIGLRLDGADPQVESISVRFRTDGAWSEWAALGINPDEGPDPGSLESERAVAAVSEPLWVGEADAYQLSGPEALVGASADVLLVREQSVGWRSPSRRPSPGRSPRTLRRSPRGRDGVRVRRPSIPGQPRR